MFRLDRNAHSSGRLTDLKKEADNYKDFSLKQIGEVFAYLQSVSQLSYQ
jgi:hypothetical protein